MNDKAKAVLDRLTGKGITCPDCGHVFTDPIVEKYSSSRFQIDFKNKKIYRTSSWVIDDDWSYRCPQCESLNIDNDINNLIKKGFIITNEVKV